MTQQHRHQQNQDQHDAAAVSTAAPPCRQRSLSVDLPLQAVVALEAALSAVSWRVLPVLCVLVTVCYLDRSSLAYASIQLQQHLQLSGTVYGLGAGAFFLAYAAGQVPSNFLLLRVGGPRWLACICVAWGAAASCLALVAGPTSFVLLRMLLGLAESGALPGTWYYISTLYPATRVAMPYTIVETGITVSQVLAAPIATALLLLDGRAGLRGYQWLFLLEGLPALLLGCFIGCWLPQSIRTARFLSAAEREALWRATPAGAAAAAAGEQAAAMAECPPSGHGGADTRVDVAPQGAEETQQLLQPAGAATSDATSPSARTDAARQQPGASNAPAAPASLHHRPYARLSSTPPPGAAEAGGSSSSGCCCGRSSGHAGWQPGWRDVWAAARNPVVLYSGCWRILHDVPGNGVLYWTPKIIQALLVADAGAAAAAGAESRVVLLSTIPYAAASLVHLVIAWHSQHVGEAKLHIGCTWLVGAAALCALPFAASGALAGGASGAAAGSSVAAFVCLCLAHVGVNGANGLQTSLVSGSLPPANKALGLAVYNTIGCIGSFFGPLLIGVLHDATHGGYALAMWVLGACLAGAAAMVVRFRA